VPVDPNYLLETEEPDPAQRLLRLPEQSRTEVAPADFELAAVREVDRLREKMFVRMRQLGAVGT